MEHPLTPRDVGVIGRTLRELAIRPGVTETGSSPSMALLGPFNQCTLGVVRFRGQTPWERHPGGDELVHVVEGAVEVTVLTDDGPVHRTVTAGSIFVVPSGCWHRQYSVGGVVLLFATATEVTEHSWEEDPRPR